MISTSLKTTSLALEFPPRFVPHPVMWRNYWDTLNSEKMDFPLFTRNTLVIAVLVVCGTVVSSTLVAYGFARIRFKGRGVLFGLMLSTMMILFPVVMAPLFIVFKWLNDHTGMQWLGTFKPLWVPAWCASAFNVFLLRQFFMTIPDDLSEAARIDGCSEFGHFLADRAATVASGHHGRGALHVHGGVERFPRSPGLYPAAPEQYTLALGLRNFQSQHGGTDWNLLMAGSVLVILPVLVLFFLAQKTFIEGIATTGMKG